MADQISAVQRKSRQKIKRLEQQGNVYSKGCGGLRTYPSKNISTC